MSLSTSGLTMILVACFGQLCAGCGQNTPDHLDFALRTLSFELSSDSPEWRQAPATLVPNMICAGPLALITDCCLPPPPASPIDCQQYPIACDPDDNFCASTFDMEQGIDLNLVADVPEVAAVDGNVFSRVALLSFESKAAGLDGMVAGLDKVSAVRSASLYIGPSGMRHSSNPAARLLAPVKLVPGTSALVLSADAQQAFSSFARDYRTPFSLLLSAHFVVRNGTMPAGTLTFSVDGRAQAWY